jgi:hypothetical protein
MALMRHCVVNYKKSAAAIIARLILRSSATGSVSEPIRYTTEFRWLISLLDRFKLGGEQDGNQCQCY